MDNSQITNYVKSQKLRGVLDSDIRNALLTQGWKEEEINIAFNLQLKTPDNSTPKINKPKHILKKVVISLVIFIVLNVILVYSYLPIRGIFAKDIPPINDQDILISPTPVPKDQNALFVLVKLKSSSVYTSGVSDVLNDPSKWDDASVQDVLAKNNTTLPIFDEALSKPLYQHPLFIDPSLQGPESLDDTFTKIDPFAVLKLGTVVALKAQTLSRQGKDKEALEEAIKIVELGQKMIATETSLTDYLTGIGLKGIGLSATQRVVSKSNLSSKELIQKIAQLEKYKINTEGLKNSFRGEYLFVRGNIDYVENEKNNALKKLSQTSEDNSLLNIQYAQNNFTFQPNKSKKIVYNFYKQAISDTELNCNVLKDYEFKEIETVPPLPILMVSENSIGTILTSAFLNSVSIESQIPKRCVDTLRVSMVQTLLALKAYKLDNNKLPNALEELVPKYLPTLPNDIFSNKPLLYQPSKNILYSAGLEGVDVGGSEGNDWTKVKNPTIKIEF